jgi:hypothetical protein
VQINSSKFCIAVKSSSEFWYDLAGATFAELCPLLIVEFIKQLPTSGRYLQRAMPTAL